jgi:4-aminobutyrate---pyruvate transaminase
MRPPIARTKSEARRQVAEWHREGLTVGVVPTMGALHEGHLALVDRAREECDRCLVTLFVNPIQFGPGEDYESYPRDECGDLAKLARRGCDLVFMPDVAEMFPDDADSPHDIRSIVSVRGLGEALEAGARPGHFQGMATEVTKLLLITQGEVAYFGEKDYQQLRVVERMVRDLDIPTRVQGVPIVREPDGLAMSSRNAYLDAGQRAIAPRLHGVLAELADELAEPGVDVAAAAGRAAAALRESGFDQVDYVAVVDAETLGPLDCIGDRPARALAAARIGRTRLIDNVPVPPISAPAGPDAGRRDVDSLLHPFTNAAEHEVTGPMFVGRGEGIHVFDDRGRAYIEGIAGLWCTSLGFSEQELVDAAIRQMRALPAYHLGLHRSTLPVVELAERLKAVAPGTYSKAFFVGSGSEANETQIKLLWYYNNALGRPRKKTIISRDRAYHGVTLGAGSLTGLAEFHREFDLPVVPVRHVTCPHHYRCAEPGESERDFSARLAAELEDLIVREGPDTVAGFIAEPVMGAGGVIVPPEGYFEAVQDVLRRYDVRFICDEVICGFGRTGSMWGAETFGIHANSISCAKGLSSAYMPIGAVLIDEPMYDAVVEQSRRHGSLAHGFTFGGHPTAAAVALRTLQLMEERDVVGHVRRLSGRFRERLRSLGEHPLVGEARGVGLLGGVELVADRRSRRPFERELRVGARCAALALEAGLIVRPLGDTLAICPPLIIQPHEVDELFDLLAAALDRTADWLTRQRVALA